MKLGKENVVLPIELFSRGSFGNKYDKKHFDEKYKLVADHAKSLIIKRECLDCDKEHRIIFYKRISNLKNFTFEIYSNFIE